MSMRTEHCRITILALLLAGATGACAKSGDEMAAGDSSASARAGSSTAAGDSGGMPSMQGMGSMKGMPGMTDSSMAGMSSEMHTHMMALAGASVDSMKRMLPMHRQMVANMIARMNGEMRDMKMAGDLEWTATLDSLRKDLVRLPELGNAELAAMMPAHMARVTRLSGMHQNMMRSMSAK